MSDQDRVNFIIDRCSQLMELLKTLVKTKMSTVDTYIEIQLLHKEYNRITGRVLDIDPVVQKEIVDLMKK